MSQAWLVCACSAATLLVGGWLGSQQLATPKVSDSGLTTLVLSDGSKVQGELIHTFTQQDWWHPTPETTYALSQPQGFAPGHKDLSLRFLSTPEVVSVIPPSTPEIQGHQLLLRSKGIALNTLPLTGVSHVFTHSNGYHLEEDGYGDFAWDLMRTDQNGLRFTGSGVSNQDYLVWNKPVYLPTEGVVVEVVRDEVDNAPGSYTPGSPNNMVGIHIKGAYSLYLLHFREGTIPAYIQPGVTLPEGAYLGRVGNSGVSLEPHLHLTMLWWDQESDPPRFWSVPAEFQNLHTRKLSEPDSTLRRYATPEAGSWISASSF
ncbi:MAG: hypothetical protein COA70_10245 [Planctomycetota bacterium]|nr:MAG: hypothetical protein COA70_10245 [Planctomycetota bacterium]